MRLSSPITRRSCSLPSTTLALALTLLPGPVSALSMTFINPGYGDEPHWIMAVRSMEAAATSLGIKLEVLTAERDPLAQIRLTRDVAQRAAAERPDYLIIAAGKGALAAQLAIADHAGIPTFVAFNNVRASERARVGYPRGKFPLWLGSLSPDVFEAGYLSARALILHGLERLPAGATVGMIALAGDRSTDTSLERNQGMLQAVAEFPQVQLYQQVSSDWSYAKAAEQAHHLYQRYPDVQLVWAGSDLLAFGAMQALRESGRVPGRDIYFAAVSAAPAALQSLQSGELTALAGGHHMSGAWAMVMLYDHFHGLDFVPSAEGAEQTYSMSSAMDQETAAELITQPPERPVDFCRFSRVCNPARTQYDFSFDSWLELGE